MSDKALDNSALESTLDKEVVDADAASPQTDSEDTVDDVNQAMDSAAIEVEGDVSTDTDIEAGDIEEVNQDPEEGSEVDQEDNTEEDPDIAGQAARHHRMPDWVKYGFPPPEFLRFNFTGLNLSDHSIKICKSVIDHEYYVIEVIDTISLPDGAIVNGEIQDPGAVTKVLKKIKDTYGVNFVRLSVPEEQVYLDTFSIPPTDDEKLRSVVEFHIGDHIPLSIDEIQFDFDATKRTKSNKVSEVVATAVSKSVVEELMNILTAADLVPLSLEIEAQAIARVVVPKNDTGTYMVLDIGRSRTGLSIVTNGVVRYTTTVGFGGDMIVTKIIELRGIDASEAEKIKQASGIDLTQYSASESSVIEDALKVMLEEIRRRHSFWHSQNEQEISGLLLVGGNASTPGLASYLERQTNIPCQVPDVWQNIFSPQSSDRPVSDNEALSYAAVLGLSINEEK